MSAPVKAAYSRAKPLPRDLAAFAKRMGESISPITGPAEVVGFVPQSHPGRWWKCLYREGGVEAATDAAHAAGFSEAWAECDGFTWLYLRHAKENE